jgi:hypothetical protein
MYVGRFATRFEHSLIGTLLIAVSFWPSGALAQGHDTHTMAPQQHEQTPDEKKRAGALVKAVQEATDRFHDVEVAKGEQYGLLFGCVSGGDFGAMGLHFVKGSLLGDGEVKVDEPEIVLYEPLPNGKLRLTGADYLVYADDWNAKHPDGPPQLMGQLFHLFDSPNRFGLRAFYTLHVWAWKENPAGTFTNWNPNVSCDAFNPSRE